ncbi:polysaccharide deacetylase family protein [Haloarcula pellucida]|uniref:NodB homology domain-containing protein n=1 Tax=Haloarcula pellucida TaxID=1427151 RepID=A0A830GKT1_9EURY|nr:polysaccharide deacetylase family protein [Halomicroarcula pellucida]MBX0349764.1 polysaccharide deacetylase family protein [Halomicroarcula pellucida]GGN94196.1 hypothetical protein GCM10009030_20350 [Halomicroarcula pellucida]
MPATTEYDSRERYAHPGDSYEDFETLSKWSVRSGTLTESPIAFTGSQSARLVGENGNGPLIERSVAGEDFSDTEISMAVRTPTPSRIAINIRLVDSSGNWLARSLRQISHRHGDIAWFRTAPGTFTTSGDVFDVHDVDRLQVHVLNASDARAEVLIDDMRLHSKPDKGYIILSWDDGREIYYEDAAPIHDRFDFPVTMAAAPQLVGKDTFMSLGQLEERQRAGDEIVSHATIAFDFHQMSAERLAQTLRQNKTWLVERGFEQAEYIVYPGNNYDGTVLSVAPKYHYAGGMNQAGDVNTTGVYSFDPLVLPRTIGHDLDIAKRVVDNVGRFRNCGILNFHHFDERNTMDVEEYEQLLGYIDQQGDAVEVITIDDLWEMRKRA